MTGVGRFPARDPQCQCPEVTFTSGPTAEQTSACRDRSGGRLHRVLTPADVAALVRVLRVP